MFTLEEMERHYDPMILEYVRKRFTTKQLVGTKLEFIEEDSKGNKRFKSYGLYEDVLDKVKYAKEIHEHFVKNFPEFEEGKQKNKLRKKKEIGRNVTQKEFFQTIFRNLFNHRKNEIDSKGRRINVRSFLMNIDTETRLVDGAIATHSMEHLYSKMSNYEFFTPSMFISHRFFTKEMLTLMGVIVLDFDLDSHGLFMTKEELYHFIEKNIKIPPSMIWDTKTRGNYQACILIEPMCGTPASVHLYEQIVKEMNNKLKISDLSCSQANHVFRIGRNDARNQRFVRKYNENIYSIDRFRWLLHERDERRRKENADNSKVVDFSLAAIRRHPAVQALFQGEIVGWRDHAGFTLALVMRFLGYSKDECENFILSEWQPKVDNREVFGHPFTTREASKCVRNAYSDKYKSFHSKWIEIVTGMECNLKGYMYVPYEAKGIYITDTEARFKTFLQEHGGQYEGKIQDFVDLLGVKRTTFEELLYRLRDAGELEYQTKRGRGARTTFRLLEQKQLGWKTVFELDSPKNIDEELLQIAELEAVVQEMTAV